MSIRELDLGFDSTQSTIGELVPPVHYKHLYTLLSSSEEISPNHKEKIVEICRRLPRWFYISRDNAPVVLTLLKNVVQCFDPRGNEGTRYRRCNVVLGLKNTGKSTLVRILKKAIKKWDRCRCLVLFATGKDLCASEDTFTELLLAKCRKRGFSIDEDRPTLRQILKTLYKRNISTLIILDEAQEIYPRNDPNLPETVAYRREQRTRFLISELCTVAEQPGCVGWLTGSSQALRSLYANGYHPHYLGIYSDLNDKKYWALNYVGLRDARSIRKLFLVSRNEEIDDVRAARLFESCGGATGDLLMQMGLQQDVMSTWTDTAWDIVWRIAQQQPTTNENFPWCLRPIVPSEVLNAIRKSTIAAERTNPTTLLQDLCDQYVLERDGEGNYRIPYPTVIRNFGRFYQQYHSESPASHRYISARKRLEEDDIPGFLRIVLEAMHNIPYSVNDKLRKYEGLAHSIIHTLLWFCHPPESQFDSGTVHQTGVLDLVFVNRYRHYIELKNENTPESAEQACAQITRKRYDLALRSQYDRKKPAFFYGVKWTNHSTCANLVIDADGEARETPLWSEIRSINRIDLPSH
jgi:hypothetical protein